MVETSHVLVTPVQLGSILQAARKERGLTQASLAARMGMSQSRISYLELHAEQISLGQLLTWCAVLRLELSVGERDGAEPPRPTLDW